MNGDDFDVRRIVRGLRRITPVSGSSDDPFGLGKKLKTPSLAVKPAYYFPRGIAANAGLVRSAQHPVMGLHEDFRIAAYGALFARPHLMCRMPDPGQNAFEEIDDRYDSALKYEQLAVAVVVQPEDPRNIEAPDVSAAPQAGSGKITVVSDGIQPVRTFADVTWVDTTDAFAEHLARLWRECGAPPRTGVQRLVVVSETPAAFTRDEGARMTDEARVYGFDLEVIASSRVGEYRRRLRSNPPGHLLLDKRSMHATEGLSADFRKTASPDRELMFEVGTDEVAAVLRAIRCAAALGPGLVSTHTRPNPRRAPELHRNGRAWLHPRFGKFVEEAPGVVLTRDLDKHAESTFKQYSIDTDGLNWVADLDENREVINKHKSPVGKFVPWDQLGSL
ncbi:hypothetical protein [Cellulomonas endometrii]|uniref:hypothetical protein n=1 Tax=Cellulomonas endometrii TaxID=3036301 RepID=UPI0024AC956F|nr:hypothetical protein [Cellulomonas endometrii]